MNTIYIGTRGSDLALWQARHAALALSHAHPHLNFELKTYTSAGDVDQEKPLPLIGGKGVFTEALDQGLLKGEIALAVHSFKDLPIAENNGIATAAVLEREQAHDIVIAKSQKKLADLPAGAVIGTSSTRRSAQLLSLNPSFVIKNIRGNVPTRINKVLDEDGDYDATLLAYAGVKRLGLLAHCSELLDFSTMLPAPAQGTIAIQCLRSSPYFSLCAVIDHKNTRLAAEAERGFLFGLGGGCSMPIAAFSSVNDGDLMFTGKVICADGKKSVVIEDSIAITDSFAIENAFSFGVAMGERAIERGAKKLLDWRPE